MKTRFPYRYIPELPTFAYGCLVGLNIKEGKFWLENFSNNAAKSLCFCKVFFIKVWLEIDYFLNFDICCCFLDANFVKL